MIELRDVSHLCYKHPTSVKPIRLYKTDENAREQWLVQVFLEHGPNQTPWEGMLRVSIKHTISQRKMLKLKIKHFDDPRVALPITWDDMQEIKDKYWPEQIGMEIFPPKDDVVNVADMRWMWILPKAAILPFNLSGDRNQLG